MAFDIDDEATEQRAGALRGIAQRSARRHVVDPRSADEILGFGTDGLPS